MTCLNCNDKNSIVLCDMCDENITRCLKLIKKRNKLNEEIENLEYVIALAKSGGLNIAIPVESVFTVKREESNYIKINTNKKR